MESPGGKPGSEQLNQAGPIRRSWLDTWVFSAVLFTLVLAAPAGMFDVLALPWSLAPPEPGEFVCLTGLVLIGPPVGLVFGGVLAYFGGTALYSEDLALKRQHTWAALITSILYAAVTLPGALAGGISDFLPGMDIGVLFGVRYFALLVLTYSLARLVRRQLAHGADA